MSNKHGNAFLQFLLIICLAIFVSAAPMNVERKIPDIGLHNRRAEIVHFDAGSPFPLSGAAPLKPVVRPERRMLADDSDAVDARDQHHPFIHPVMMARRDDPSFREEVQRRWFKKHYHIGVEY